jgi:hypothetical protein
VYFILEYQMKIGKKCIGACCVFLLVLGSAGCSAELKALAINQVVGLASQLTSALATSAINSIVGGQTTTTE